MTRVVVSPEAEADLQQLTDRIADAAGFVVATNFIDRIVSTVDVLSAIPKAPADLCRNWVPACDVTHSAITICIWPMTKAMTCFSS